MSMIGQFVQISSDQMAELIDDPSEIEDLFAALPPAPNVPAAAMQRLASLGETQRKQFLERGHQMFEATLARMDPRLRDEMRKRLGQLGVDPAGLESGASSEALLKLMATRAGFASGAAPAKGQGASAALSIDKSWHGIHYLLCAAAEPTSALISQAIMGGTELGDDFSGYGPARYFTVAQAVAMSAELSQKTLESQMTARFNPAQMTRLGIYPNQWAGPDLQWLMREFRNLRGFYADASAHGLAVVTCLV